jgi:hypothetical protein
MADANITDEALDWDSEVTATSSQFTTLEPGTYSYKVTDFKRASFDGSSKMAPCPEADITIACANAQGAQSDVRFKLFLNKKMQWKITQFFKSCGLIDADLPDGTNYAMGPLWKQVLGRTGKVEIKNRTYQDKTYNEVDRFVVEVPAAGASRYGEGF